MKDEGDKEPTNRGDSRVEERRGPARKIIELNISNPPLMLSSVQSAIDEIGLLHQRYVQTKLAKYMLLTGQSGSGKSTILKEYRDAHPTRILEETTHIPVLYFEIPGGTPTVPDVASQILASMGDPAAFRGSVMEKTKRIHDNLRDCEVELLLMDEFHNLLKEDRKTPIARATMWLKTLVNKANRPFVACGLPRSRLVLTSNTELDRRFGSKHYVEPMVYSDDEAGKHFRATLKALQSRLPIQCETPFHEKNLARRFYFASRGLIDYIVRIIDRATVIAIRANCPISTTILAKAFVDEVWKGCPPHLNPFLTEQKLRILDQPGEPFSDWESDPGAKAA